MTEREMNRALALLCVKPDHIWCHFLNDFQDYAIYVILDDADADLTEFDQYHNISFIKIDNDKCEQHGYVDMNFLLEKRITAWEKAVYYFANENTQFDQVWFLEDDVFFVEEATLQRIDAEYLEGDLLSNSLTTKTDDRRDYWHWWRVEINYPLPYYEGMMCIVRMSRPLLERLAEYAAEHHTLFFLETLFPTVAYKNGLVCISPPEFSEVRFRHDFEKKDINSTTLYHPIKKLENHILFRA
jgi:hypothetical protein